MAGSYIDHHYRPDEYLPAGASTHDVSHSWVMHTRRALVWHYGDERAHLIMTNRDPATEADKASWNALGR